MIAKEEKIKIQESDKRAISLTGHEVEFYGMISFCLLFNGRPHKHNFYITKDANYNGALLIGLDFLHHFDVTMHFGSNKLLSVKGQTFKYDAREEYEDYESIRTINEEIEKKDEEFRVINTKHVVIPANTIYRINAVVVAPKNTNRNLIVENVINNKYLRIERALVNKNRISIGCMNASDKDMVLKHNQTVAIASPVEDIKDKIPEIEMEDIDEQIAKLDLNHLSKFEQDEIKKLIRKNAKSFSTKSEPLGLIHGEQHEIHTEEGKVSYVPQYRQPQIVRQKIEDMADDLLARGVVRRCNSAWNSPILLVTKKDGTSRFTVDLRGVNAITENRVHPIPKISETLDSLANSKYFSTLDAKSGYWQLKLRESDQEKTAFRTATKTLCFSRMPFGLKTASFSFQNILNKVLRDALGIYSTIYIDDVVIYSETFDQHISHLDSVLQMVAKAGIKMSLNKSQFAQEKIKFLGFIVDGKGINSDPEKVRAIQNFPIPKNQKNVRQFLATVGFYRQFIEDFAGIAAPLSSLLRKDVKWKWETLHQDAFQKLKCAMVTHPILRHPDFERAFQIHSDASCESIGGCLMQEHEGVLHPVSYFSRKLRDAETRYSVSEWEALGVIASIKQFHYYIYGRKFKVVVDHKPLVNIFKVQSKNNRINRWASFLMDYDFETVYKQGKLHHLPDALSRNCDVDALMVAINALKTKKKVKDKILNKKPIFSEIFSKENVKLEQNKEERWKLLIKYLKGGEVPSCPPRSSLDNFTLVDQCLYFSSKKDKATDNLKLVVPLSLQKDALKLVHDSQNSIHAGFLKTLFKAQGLFYWPNMVLDIKNYVKHCMQCLKRKSGIKNKAAMGDFPPVSEPNERIGLDLIGILPQTERGNRFILTVHDHFSKYTYIYPIPGKSAEVVTRAFRKHILLAGVPSYITSDRGSEFIANTFRELCETMRITTNFATAFRPQACGAVENRNKIIGDYLHFLSNESNEQWDDLCEYVQAAINSAYHVAIRDTPFFIHHGRDYKTIYSDILSGSKRVMDQEKPYNIEVQERLTKAFEQVKQNNINAHETYKKAYNKNLRPHNIGAGDIVLVRNEIKQGQNIRKLNPRYNGPYRVIKFVNDNNCIIKGMMQNNSRELLVHTDRLKMASPSNDPYPMYVDAKPLKKNILIDELSSDEDNKAVDSDKSSSDDEIIINDKKKSSKNKRKKRIIVDENADTDIDEPNYLDDEIRHPEDNVRDENRNLISTNSESENLSENEERNQIVSRYNLRKKKSKMPK